MLRFDFHRLKELRKQNRMSQQDTAERMHCKASNISRWELGKTPISAEKLACLADIYGDNRIQDFFVNIFSTEEKRNEK